MSHPTFLRYDGESVAGDPIAWECDECGADEWSCECEVEAPLPPLTDEQRVEAMARIDAAFARRVEERRKAA